MALIRSVIKHQEKELWAYVEFSDENQNHEVILGGKEFPTEEEAEEWSKGFKPFSYDWVDPKVSRKEDLVREKEELLIRLAKIDLELAENG